MRHFIFYLSIFALLFTSCMKGKKVDLIVHNAIIHSLDDSNKEYEAMAILDGKIIELGPERQILNKYRAKETVDARGRHIYPGLTDAHAHLKLTAKSSLGIDLKGVKSFEQIVFKLEQFHAKNPTAAIIGRGWSEMDWADKTVPTNQKLNELFPNIPVCLYRIDEHSALVNDFLLEKANLNATTKLEGAQLLILDGKLTGFVTDQALEKINAILPQPKEQDLTDALLNLQEELFMYGITSVHDAGFEDGDYAYYKKLIDDGLWQLQTFGMFMPTEANFKLAESGKLSHKNLKVGTFKFFIDGSLGSHGALLKRSYSDRTNDIGTLNISLDKLNQMVERCSKLGYQAAFHAIGDSAVHIALQLTTKFNTLDPDHRWRLEHGIVIDTLDYSLLLKSGIIPSFQPLQAASDASFLLNRLGENRLKMTYAFNPVFKQTGLIILGSDFPIESHNIHRTLFEAINTTEAKRKLPLETALKAVTLWPALAVFEDKRTGSLEKGKEATFAIFMKAIDESSTFKENFSMQTFIKGKEVYSAE